MTSAEEEADRALTRQAEEELLREACRGRIRAEIQGPSGWLKCPLPSTNKTFLRNTIRNTVSSNNRRSRKRSHTPQNNSAREDSTSAQGDSKKKHR
ncbi:protein POLR1D-like [Arctopsyche grandis]|uniref:protein POLR1D-like n=1 Tax=Arctopsyche grandis TaxID=121162 RepID=UPI00406D7FF0